jgi:hypothetical protein
MTGSSKSIREVTNKMKSFLKAIGPLSRLYLAKNEDREGCNTHFRSCFAQLYLYLSLIALILQGEFPHRYFNLSLLVSL